MSNRLSKACGVDAHSLYERGPDQYATPPEAVHALLRAEAEWLPTVLWEPACGDGAIVLPLRAAGYRVLASDLLRWGDCPDAFYGMDFLRAPQLPPDFEGIVTNPPYRHAQEFVEQALRLSSYVAMLLRLAFLEGVGRKQWFEGSPLARVHVFSRRLPMMHRRGWNGPRASSAVVFAWYVWDRRHAGEPVIRWLDWKEKAA